MKDGPPARVGLPDWIPPAVRDYVLHTRDGTSIRALARRDGCPPSTISRRVRRIEHRRDDPLVDSALQRFAQPRFGMDGAARPKTETSPMSEATKITLPDDSKLERESMRVLRRLAEQGACLALAPAMETAVVVREVDGGPTVRTAVVEKSVAEAMALKEWIGTKSNGRILRYRITPTGRAALRELVARAESRKAREHGTGFAEEQHDFDGPEPDATRRRAMRYSLAESPLVALARRRDRLGEAFLDDSLVAAGERLREDFELAQIGQRGTRDCERVLAGELPQPSTPGTPRGAEDARDRLNAALTALGPGLGDVAFGCCCLLEGLESAERRMGWSARSGKIVLRIALQRLKLHYDENADRWSPLIG